MDENTLARLRQVISRMSRQLGRGSTDEGLTPTQASALGAIARRGPVSLSALARSEGLHASLLSRVIAALERRGLISRAADPADLRSVVVNVTRSGRVAAARIRDNRSEVLAEAAALLGEEQQHLITAALPALELMVERMLERDD